MPLTGIRVLDLGSMVAAPLGATLLGDMGAEVIKIEPPGGEEGRRVGPRRGDDTGLYIGVNRNKRGMVLDLTRPQGQEVLARLVAHSDIVIHNVRSPAREKLGLDYAALCRIRPDIILVTVSTYGETGPYAGRPGIDPSAQALGGLIAGTGEPGGPALKAGAAVADVTAATLIAYTAMVALWARARDGQGQAAEVALIDGVVHLQPVQLGEYLLTGSPPPRVGNRSPFYAPYNSYRCADGGEVHLAAFNDKFYRNLCRALDAPELAVDPRFVDGGTRLKNRDALDREMATRCAQFSRAELMTRLQHADVVAAPINDYPAVASDPQLQHNHMLESVQHAIQGPLTIPGIPLRLARTPGAIRRPPPALGEHSAQILGELDYSVDAIAQMAAGGLLGNSQAD
ncbi:MAG: CaiB/BaiF CoA transferase family protein [Immundisolibacter sp.]|uniref:CaiB/BaiF CoA transferase family protein n=1 Tax=Immundisolibacter sp. TaxID=1934948 RepID=UPI003EDEE953